jgi:disulfide bond formation protein DsbB
MYPIVAVSVVGILLKDKNLPLYIFPLSISGLLISIYHNLLYYKIIPEAIAPCVQGVPCTQQLIQMLGFIDIPQGALFSWILINLFVIIYFKYNKSK